MNFKKFIDYTEAYNHIDKNRLYFKKLYIDDNLTARQVAEKANCQFDNNFQKALFRICGKKGLGLGGARANSGQKPTKSLLEKLKKAKEKEAAAIQNVWAIEKELGISQCWRFCKFYVEDTLHTKSFCKKGHKVMSNVPHFCKDFQEDNEKTIREI